ncbi:LrgB family protein [Salirhabdus sp. Marseille-P4669]|uniref:LrgB family protein n=1 Tax=Salirhabdus sp. Marseille-P4669 TaxID=2042310 RepID=UPI000C7AEB5F|nr:LrgB family protein [Salirhabdus sp. Marseille-P4669]
MSEVLIGIGGILFTLILYMLTRALNKRFPHPITLPIFVSTIIGILILLLFQIPYETYMIGGNIIEWLLGPAVVALAYPLYKQWELLKKNPIPIIVGVSIGASIGITFVILIAKWMKFDDDIIFSLIPENSTTAVATEVTKSIGGIPSLTAVFVMIAGIGGAVIGPTLLRLFKIDHYLGKGVGMGTASHAIGTSKIMEDGEKEGAFSTVAMTICAVVISIISPLMAYLFL